MTRTKLLATTLIAGFAALSTANGQTTVYGGGSRLAQWEYLRAIDAIGPVTGFYDTAAVSGNPGATGQTGNVLYTADGGGPGRQAFLTQDETIHVPGSTQRGVHFGASDIALTQAQIDCWNSGYASNSLTSGGCAGAGYNVPSTFTGGRPLGGPLIQLPAFGVPIAIAYHAGTGKTLTLSDWDLCGIFSGAIVQWDRTSLGPKIALAGLSGPIAVAYLDGASGTTFMLTQHLSKACTTGSNGNAAIAFTPTRTFSSLFSGGTPPSNFSAQPSFAAEAEAILATSGAIGYLTPDYTSVAPNSVPNSTAGSSFNAWLPNPASHYLQLKTAKIFNQHQGKSYAPNTASTNLALKNPNLSAGDTIARVPASQAALLNASSLIPVIADPLQGYPIVGYTTLEFAQCYANMSVAREIKAWITQLYTAANKSNYLKEGFTAVPAGFGSQLLNAYTSNKTGFGTDIGNTAVCNPATYAGL